MNVITGHTTIQFDDKINVATPTPEAWEWYRGNRNGDVHIFEDTLLQTHIDYNDKIKIAMIMEVDAIYDNAKQFNHNMFHPYEWLKTNHQHFDYVMGPFLVLKDIVGEEKYVWTSAQNSFISRDQIGMYEKERLLSIIASAKRWTPGHKLRHEIIEKYRSNLDVYGGGYNTILNDYGLFGKVIALAPYYFTIIAINTITDDFFSEQLTDAMSVGTIPIFWGTKGISKHFNMDGIIQFDNINELGGIIASLSKELYESKKDAVLENLELSKKYITTVDWLYNNKREFLENIKSNR